MYFRRKIDQFLMNWKNDPAYKPLIVKGARQIGKTESILHFANENYRNVVYINFVLDKKFSAIVSDVICSGSMPGVNYKKIHSNSVGNKCLNWCHLVKRS